MDLRCATVPVVLLDDAVVAETCCAVWLLCGHRAAAAAGVVAYTGSNTKLALNQLPAPTRFSTVEQKLNRFVLMLFIIQMSCCALQAGLSIAWDNAYIDGTGGRRACVPFCRCWIVYAIAAACVICLR